MSNFVMVAETFLTGVWKMMLETDIPGTDVSVAGFSIALLLIGFSVRLLGFLSGFRGGGSYGAAASSAEKARSAYQKYKDKNG